MNSLKHNGVLVKKPEYHGFKVTFKGQEIKMTSVTEEMAIAWCKKIGTPYVEDDVFHINFFGSFSSECSVSNPAFKLIENEFDFSEIITYLENEKKAKENLTIEQKKESIKIRKLEREALKEKYGYAYIDGEKVEISNYIVEPSSIFMGRGRHPKRGMWKQGASEKDIILNLSPDSPIPAGNWKKIVWEPESYWVAKWLDEFSNKYKYVWISDSAPVKQEKDREKFDKATNIDIEAIQLHIANFLESPIDERKKLATVCALIDIFNIRVGDEKDDSEEADTVGALTLRPEHITTEYISTKESKLTLKFLGKDSIQWEVSSIVPYSLALNLEIFMKDDKPTLFYGIDSFKVARFLQEVQPGMTAKIFRTYKATDAVKTYLMQNQVTKANIEEEKKYHAKMANLQAAKICNHKKKVSPKYADILKRKEDKLQSLLNAKASKDRIRKAELDMLLFKATSDYNLNTSLKSYIDPREFVEYCKKTDLELKKIYSNTLLKKISWAQE